MTATPEEISAGQKAYRRYVALEKNKLGAGSIAFIVITVGLQTIADLCERHYFGFALGMLVFLTFPIGISRMNLARQKHYETLQQLKAKYGEGIYDEITTEPSSLEYRLTQKSYGPIGQSPKKIELP